MGRGRRRLADEIKEALGRPQDEDPRVSPQDEMRRPQRTQDDFSVRAKSSGHGKKTADKWNQ
jgi:hypothetical protein